MRKMQMMLFSGLLCCMAVGAAKAQSVAISKEEMGKVFEKSNTWFRTTPAYELKVTHASYEDYTSDIPADKSTGYFKKEGDNYHSLLLGIHTIQNKKYKLVIDTAHKIIAVANPDQLAWISYTQEDYQALLKNSTATRMSKTGRYTFYRVELSQANAVGAYEFLIDENGLAREIRWYYNREIKKDPNNAASGVKPRMSISFSGYQEEPFNYSETFSEAPYFKSENNKLIATGNYSSFKLLDQRLKK